MPTCPAGHDSTDDEFCDVCGREIGGPAPASGAATVAAPATAPDLPAPGATCPACGADLAGRFCEACGQDSLAAPPPTVAVTTPPDGAEPGPSVEPVPAVRLPRATAGAAPAVGGPVPGRPPPGPPGVARHGERGPAVLGAGHGRGGPGCRWDHVPAVLPRPALPVAGCTGQHRQAEPQPRHRPGHRPHRPAGGPGRVTSARAASRQRGRHVVDRRPRVGERRVRQRRRETAAPQHPPPPDRRRPGLPGRLDQDHPAPQLTGPGRCRRAGSGTIGGTMTLTEAPLIQALPADPDPDALFDAFSSWAEEQGLTLYPAQQEAMIEIVSGSNVILSTPTGSGKSMVAAGAHFAALAQGQRTFYTAPIKALVSEKFFALCDMFGAVNVGMLTGDSSVNPGAPIICCTAEILANIALREGAAANVGQVVMDEFHFYADPDRGWAWQVPLLELPRAQFLLMSATLGDVSFFERDLPRRTGRPTAVVTSAQRPVPLYYSFRLTPLHETIEELLGTNQAPIYVVHFTQAAALERAQSLMSINVCTRAEKDQIAVLIGNFRFTAGFGKTLSRLVRHGIGVHHAGMLPKYRRLVERLAQAGLMKIVCGTDTLGVGINVPIRTVVFTALSKYDGQKVRLLKAREFHQIAGRAGRAGYDTVGNVIVQAPEHVIENEKALAKAGDDPKKRRKVVRKKPPEGSIGWGEPTFQRLIEAEPEPLTSSFQVTHAMLLNVIGRPGDAFTAMRHLLEDNHEERPVQRRLIRRAIAIYRALLAAGVVEKLPEPDEQGRIVRLTVDLQLDFALNQPLSPLALATIDLLDRDDPG